MAAPSDTGPATNSGDGRRPDIFTVFGQMLRTAWNAVLSAGARRILRQYHRLDRRAHLDAELDDPDFDR
jgi:hypothetical protein